MAASFLAALGAAGCTSVDDSLGFDFIPGDQQMAIAIDTVYGFKTYLAQTDSITANNHGVAFLGKKEDPVFGKTTAGAVVHYMPSIVGTSTEYVFGAPSDEVTAKSLYLVLAMTGFVGDETVEQTFEIYLLKDTLQYLDTTYYMDYPVEQMLEIGSSGVPVPIGKFTHEGVGPVDVKLSDYEYFNNLMDSLVKEPDAMYRYSTMDHKDFRPRFRGLYIKPADDSPQNAAIYSFDLTNSYLSLGATYTDKESGAEETSSHYYYFDDQGWPTYCTSVIKVEHEYENCVIAGKVHDAGNIDETLNLSESLTTTYVQGLNGVITYLYLTDELLADINALKTRDGETYRDIVIRQARLIAPINDTSVEAMNDSPKRLGMYYNYFGIFPTGIPDYKYREENEYGYSYAYDGYLNRNVGHGYYNMDITSYVQRLLVKPGTPQRVFLATDFNRTFNFGDVALKNPDSGEERIKLVLTYTLIK